MIYKTELHCHTSGVSNCATSTPEQTVDRYLAAGYTTIVVSNHFNSHTFTNKRFDHSNYTWEQKVDYFMTGYHELVAAANGRLHIILGCELRLTKDPNDYLLIGITEEFLRSHPNLTEIPLKELRPAINEIGGYLVQAHPFRNKMRITKPEYLDGIEVYNGHKGHDARNPFARLWAEQYGLMQFSGSDYHHYDRSIISGGIATESPITTTEDLLRVLKEGSFTLLKDSSIVPC